MSVFRKKVMWVDDEIEMLRAHIMFLETRGYSVVPVFSGDDAVDIIREKGGDFDIVLLDEQMPGKSGLAALGEIKALRPDLPVVMVTKSEEEDLMEKALGKNIDGYLTKPVNPSQILLVCKRLLEAKQFIASEVKQQFLRNYSENAALLKGRLDASAWARLHENLSRWDMELDKIDDAGLRQTHAGQKSDANRAFAEFIEEHYGRWIKGDGGPPLLSVNVLDKSVDPLLRSGEQVCFIIVSGMRLDQYLGIEEMLRPHYRVRRNYFYSILPTGTLFARSALLSGVFPQDIQKNWPADDDDAVLTGQGEELLLKGRLDRAGTRPKNGFFCSRIAEGEAFQAEYDKQADKQLIVLVADFVDLLTHESAPGAIVQAIAPGERALRSMTHTWFENSALMGLLKGLARKKCSVVLTSDHGIVYCTRKTEMYGAKQLSHGLRYKFARGITADERQVVVINDPRHYRLPPMKKGQSCFIAKEDFYFAHPESFTETHQHERNAFQQGGISMDEMIMPLAVFTPL